jgi:endogenous inhibitor of DNA gyrase (YacG/DUF329 family)
MKKLLLIKRSSQYWKVLVSLWGLLMSFAVMVAGILFFPEKTLSFLVALAGVVLGVASFLFACLSIRCPSCYTHWVWKAISQEDASKWLVSLMSQTECPTCGRIFASNDRNGKDEME